MKHHITQKDDENFNDENFNDENFNDENFNDENFRSFLEKWKKYFNNSNGSILEILKKQIAKKTEKEHTLSLKKINKVNSSKDTVNRKSNKDLDKFIKKEPGKNQSSGKSNHIVLKRKKFNFSKQKNLLTQNTDIAKSIKSIKINKKAEPQSKNSELTSIKPTTYNKLNKKLTFTQQKQTENNLQKEHDDFNFSKQKNLLTVNTDIAKSIKSIKINKKAEPQSKNSELTSINTRYKKLIFTQQKQTENNAEKEPNKIFTKIIKIQKNKKLKKTQERQIKKLYKDETHQKKLFNKSTENNKPIQTGNFKQSDENSVIQKYKNAKYILKPKIIKTLNNKLIKSPYLHYLVTFSKKTNNKTNNKNNISTNDTDPKTVAKAFKKSREIEKKIEYTADAEVEKKYLKKLFLKRNDTSNCTSKRRSIKITNFSNNRNIRESNKVTNQKTQIS